MIYGKIVVLFELLPGTGNIASDNTLGWLAASDDVFGKFAQHRIIFFANFGF